MFISFLFFCLWFYLKSATESSRDQVPLLAYLEPHLHLTVTETYHRSQSLPLCYGREFVLRYASAMGATSCAAKHSVLTSFHMFFK